MHPIRLNAMATLVTSLFPLLAQAAPDSPAPEGATFADVVVIIRTHVLIVCLIAKQRCRLRFLRSRVVLRAP